MGLDFYIAGGHARRHPAPEACLGVRSPQGPGLAPEACLGVRSPQAPPNPPVAGRVRAVLTLPADRPGPHAAPLPSTGSAPPPLRVLHVCVVSCVLSDRGWGSIPQRLWRDGSSSWSVSGRCPPRRSTGTSTSNSFVQACCAVHSLLPLPSGTDTRR